jgi:uncharacterized repeat protein (TIGR01451 family)
MTQPNPAWYYLKIATSGTIELSMYSTPPVDIDFACWGPFADPVSPCVAQLTAGFPTPNHTAPGPSPDYPTLNMIDCSYSINPQEWCYIPNAIAGQYYILMITNYSNDPCDITFSQTSGTGSLHYASYISGSVFNDLNENGIKEFGEDTLVGKMVKHINTNVVHMTQNNGKYYFISDSGFQQIRCFRSNYWDFTTDSILTVYMPDTATHIGNVDFGVNIQDSSSDVSIDITGNPAVTNSNVFYWLTYKNEAALPKSGSVYLTLDTLTTFVGSIPLPDTQTGNILTWYYANLLSLETRQIHLALHMPNISSMGDTITTTAIIYPLSGDMYIPNNYDTLRQRIVGSYDPNDKLVNKGVGLQGYTLFGEELEYTIRFQNTGTASATQVRITDKIDNDLDIESFCLISSSHAVSVEIANDTLIFLFDNIQLPDSGTNLAASNGFVKFGIKPKTNLAENTPVTNQADIYFDYNPVVTTNQTLNTYVSVITVGTNFENTRDNKTIIIWPNPSDGIFNLTLAESTKDSRIDVINSFGQVILTKHLSTSTATLDLTNNAKGMYFIKVQSGNGVVVRKVIIE